MFKLYEISNQYMKAFDALLNNEEGAQLKIDEIKDPFDNKIINAVKYSKNIEAEYTAVKAVIDSMNARAKSLLNKIEFLENYMLTNIQETGLTDTIKCAEFSVRIQNNPASLDIHNPELIPDVYKVIEQVVKFNKNAMKQDIKDGFDIEGAKLIVKKRLVIK